MLNELHELSTSLKNANIDIEDRHPNFKTCPKYPTYWAYLDENGNIKSVEIIPREQVQQIRKWEIANGISFPAFNVPQLFVASEIEVQEWIKTLKKRMKKHDVVPVEEILSIVAFCENIWDEKVIKKLTTCFSDAATTIKKHLDTSAADPRKEAITHLIQRSQKLVVDELMGQLSDSLLRCFIDKPSEEIIDALFFYGEKMREPKPQIQIIMELYDRDNFEYPANHSEVQRWMNEQFMASASQGDKFPQVKLPVLGNVILRAMNSESPCQSRYGMTDHHSFPFWQDAKMEMKGSLEWICGTERKGKTWTDLSRRMEKPMLIFAYPSVIPGPDSLPDLAGMMGDEEDDDSGSSKETFAALAEKVTAALRGRTKETVDCEIRVFALAKMDKARTKIISSSRYSGDHVIRSAQFWQDGCRILPNVEVRSFGKTKGDKIAWTPLLVPFPAETIWCLNTSWVRYGKHAEAVHGFDINDAFSLLLGDGYQLHQTAVRALGSLLKNSSSLLLALGQANAQREPHKIDKDSWRYQKQTLLLPSLLGLLLFKLGYNKGGIMTSPAFFIGRLLNLADSLHLEYCKKVRKNSIPPQLVGNALMATAQEEPIKALSVLARRIIPYQAWARTLKDGDDVGLVRYFLKHIGEVTGQLGDAQIPGRCNDTDKAQMLLGYLSRTESESN